MSNIKYLTATNSIIAICLMVFVVERIVVNSQFSGFELFYIESFLFRPVQLITHLFLHGGISHLLLNMLGLWMFGNAIERMWGARRFLSYYFLCGLGAAIIYQGVNYYQFQIAITPLLEAGIVYKELMEILASGQYYIQFPSSEEASLIVNSPVVGASGAIYGVLLGFACLFPNHKIMLIFLPVPIAAKFFVPILLCFDLFSGVTGFPIFGNNIAHAAHIGGAMTGFLLIMAVMRKKK